MRKDVAFGVVYDPSTFHMRRRKVKSLLRQVLGIHVLKLFHRFQVIITRMKLRIMGDSVEPLLTYLDRSQQEKPLHVVPLWSRAHFISFFPILLLQDYYEFSKLLELLRKRNPKTILEIGTGYGGSILMFTRVASPQAVIIGVDYQYANWRIPLYKGFAVGDQSIRLVKGDSHSTETLKQVETILNGRKLDMLFIDGDHRYQGVKEDLFMYGSLVKHGGIIVFHDIVAEYGPVANCDVWKLWREAKKAFNHSEIVNKQRKIAPVGIGVLYV